MTDEQREKENEMCLALYQRTEELLKEAGWDHCEHMVLQLAQLFAYSVKCHIEDSAEEK